jgi:2-polyprenyl-6-methoxyphenol hydroxylase-like FAD-dependent oxidoreductase
VSRRAAAGRVLVVGGGPAGLTLACELLQRGVDVRIVDRSLLPPVHSRAAIVWPRQLELLRRIGVTSRIVERGHHVAAVAFYSQGRVRGTVALSRLTDTPYPFAVTIPQTATEAVLTERLEALGASVEVGVEVVGVEQRWSPDASPRSSPEPPRVTLRLTSGELEHQEYDWVIGADGAHSTVRRLLGIRFEAQSAKTMFGICDAPVLGHVSTRMLHYFYSGAGAIGLAPLPDEMFRIAVSLAPHEAAAVDRQLFQAKLDERALGAGSIGAPLWSAAFEARFGVAETFRRGRCFLVGDAAHVMSPAGGQGMNTGLQDAVNLGWKLGAVLAGEHHERLLDTYDVERQRAAAWVTRTTAAQTRLGLVRGSVRRGVRDVAISAAHRTGVLQQTMAPILTQLDTSYAGPPTLPARGLQVGDRVPAFVPDGDTPGASGWPALDRDRHSLLHWPGRIASSRSRDGVDAARRALPGLHHVDLSPLMTPDLIRSLGRRSCMLLTRPDGHLAAIGSADKEGLVLIAAAVRDSGPTLRVDSPVEGLGVA